MVETKLLYSEPEALVVLGVKRTLFRELVMSGRIPSVRMGRRRLYPTASLAEFVERLLAEAGQPALEG